MVSMKEKIDSTYLVYEDLYNTGKQTELSVVPEPWDTRTEGPVPSYYVEQDDLEFKGSWRLEDDNDVRSLESWDLDSPNMESSDFTENLDVKSLSSSESLEDKSEDRVSLECQEIKKQGKDTYQKVTDWRNRYLRQSPAMERPALDDVKQESSQANNLNKISVLKDERDR
ncbi:hypothetical protein ARMGADRAFT_1030121 [Armillaria gallica]|uniref:Uncharacterized protein n=1 Tax=Armillaria gallica TaxID=47427 RepID=A0A2H3DRL7_ARMGA|nr:hypothetical protein ARMGADRAFT_1030121 [Armillaria gallica]